VGVLKGERGWGWKGLQGFESHCSASAHSTCKLQHSNPQNGAHLAGPQCEGDREHRWHRNRDAAHDDHQEVGQGGALL